MASKLLNYLAVVIILFTIEPLIKCQNFGDLTSIEEKETSVVWKLINTLLNNYRAQMEKGVIIDNESDSGIPVDDDYDDGRQMRSHHKFHSKRYCEMYSQTNYFEKENFEYRPSFLIEWYCRSLRVDHETNKELKVCEVKDVDDESKSCQTVQRQITIFRRKKNDPNYCWQPETRNISVGCRCSFNHEDLRSIKYHGT